MSGELEAVPRASLPVDEDEASVVIDDEEEGEDHAGAAPLTLSRQFPDMAVPDHTGAVYVGCGGFAHSTQNNSQHCEYVPRRYNYAHWRKNVFYPSTVKQDAELKYFSGRFPSVEINTSFHGPSIQLDR